MAAKPGISFDDSEWQAAFAKLDGPLKVSLARSMAVAGGKILRDEAKQQAPVQSGKLREAIYLAYKDNMSTEQQVVYSVTWNSKLAPHGHLLEFGHWQPYEVVKLPNGDFFTTNTPLPAPKWTAAKPFLRPAYDTGIERAKQAMIERGRERLPELLAGNAPDGD